MSEQQHEELFELDDLSNLFDEEGVSAPIRADGGAQTGKARDLGFFRNIPVNVTLEVASTQLPLGDLMNIGTGAVIELDKLAGEPLDVRVNGRLLARGEVVVINGKYGLRLVDIVDDQALSPQEA